MTPKQRRALWHGLSIVVLVVLILLLVFSGAFRSRADQAADWTIRFAEANPARGAVLFVLFSAVSAMMAFASTAVLVPAAAAVWGRWGTFGLLLGGWVLGSVAAYTMGRLMTPLVMRLGYGKKLVKYRRYVSTRMKFWAVLLFCIAVPSEVPGYLFGAARYSFIKFMVAIALAEALYAYAIVIIGEKLLALNPLMGLMLIGLIVAAAVGIAALRRRIKSQPVPTSSAN